MGLSDDEIRELEKKYEDSLAAERERMHLYREAMKQEFAERDPDSVEVAVATRKELISLVPDAQVTIQHLLLHSDSDAVRGNLAKFVMTEALKVGKTEGEEDEMTKLLKSLQKKDAVTE